MVADPSPRPPVDTRFDVDGVRKRALALADVMGFRFDDTELAAACDEIESLRQERDNWKQGFEQQAGKLREARSKLSGKTMFCENCESLARRVEAMEPVIEAAKLQHFNFFDSTTKHPLEECIVCTALASLPDTPKEGL